MHMIQCRIQVRPGYFIKRMRPAWPGQNVTWMTQMTWVTQPCSRQVGCILWCNRLMWTTLSILPFVICRVTELWTDWTVQEPSQRGSNLPVAGCESHTRSPAVKEHLVLWILYNLFWALAFSTSTYCEYCYNLFWALAISTFTKSWSAASFVLSCAW